MERDKVSTYILVKKREVDYKTFTKDIIGRFKDRLEPALQAVFNTTRQINFNDVTLFPNLENYVYVSGDIQLFVGDVISLNGKQIVLDESNINSFKNTFKVAVSSKVLDSGQPHDIMNNIKEIERLQSILSTEQFVDYLVKHEDDISKIDILENPDYDGTIDAFTRPSNIEGFDVTKFSDDQILQIVNLMPKDGSKLN
jgi:hypothetical protein